MLHFRSRPSHTYGFLQTIPRGIALASSVMGSLCQGPRTGLVSLNSPPVKLFMPDTPAL